MRNREQGGTQRKSSEAVPLSNRGKQSQVINRYSVADLGEDLTGALHSNFGRGGCGGRS